LGESGERNIILWADHRAEKEAEGINRTGQGVLGFVGGVMSVSLDRGKRTSSLVLIRILDVFTPTRWMRLARDGNPENALVEESYERGGL
jgi:hypothetical protein